MTLAHTNAMLAGSFRHVAQKLHQRRSFAPFTREHPVVRARKTSALALTLFTIALGILIGARWGIEGLACYLPWLPFALILVWGGTTALRFDERGEVAPGDFEISPRPIEVAGHTAEGLA